MSALGERVVDFLVKHTHSRYVGNRDEAYTSSYRVIRLVVGFLGVSLPIVFFFVEGFVLQGGVHVRGSLSAYYHTSMQDIFVRGLCIIGLLLSTYMAGEWKSLDFGASLIAGFAVLGVVFFPTSRSGLPVSAPACGSLPQPPGCSFVEQGLGEHTTAVIHAVFAVVFILFLAVMSFLFAISEVLPMTQRPTARPKPSLALFRIHITCALVIVTAGIWAFAGVGVWELTPLYIGEVASVWAFGLSWLLAGWPRTAPFKITTTPATIQSPSPTTDAAVSS
jgi:hypothetical protein